LLDAVAYAIQDEDDGVGIEMKLSEQQLLDEDDFMCYELFPGDRMERECEMNILRQQPSARATDCKLSAILNDGLDHHRANTGIDEGFPWAGQQLRSDVQ
jgi:hypothetical protein